MLFGNGPLMTETLDQQILKVVARESTHQWAYLCHDQEEFTLSSDAFSGLFDRLSTRSVEERPEATMLGHAALMVQPSFPTKKQLVQLLVAQQYQILADHFAPEFDLRFYSLGGDEASRMGTLLFIESRHRIYLSAERVTKTHQSARLIETLSPRESEVMTMVVSGMTNQSTAVALGLSPKTIEKHRKKMMTKLKVHSVAEVARIAFDAELSAQLPACGSDVRNPITHGIV